MTKRPRTHALVHQQNEKITQTQRNVLLFSGMASLLVLVGFVQSWNVALLILNILMLVTQVIISMILYIQVQEELIY